MSCLDISDKCKLAVESTEESANFLYGRTYGSFALGPCEAFAECMEDIKCNCCCAYIVIMIGVFWDGNLQDLIRIY